LSSTGPTTPSCVPSTAATSASTFRRPATSRCPGATISSFSGTSMFPGRDRTVHQGRLTGARGRPRPHNCAVYGHRRIDSAGI
jgi:hypothetical protein